MISVAILINGEPIMARSATNTMKQDNDGQTIYKCDEGTLIKHFPSQGAVELVKKMLDTIKE